jgi:hypothetical protein
VVDLGSEKEMGLVTMSFLQDQRSWIFLPTEVECWVSNDGVNFTQMNRTRKLNSTKQSEKVEIIGVIFKQSRKKFR